MAKAKKKIKLPTPPDVYDCVMHTLDVRGRAQRRMGYDTDAELTLRTKEFFERSLEREEWTEEEKKEV